jgi:hypothetical protein
VGLALPCDLVDIDSQYPSTVSALGLTASPGCARITSVDCTDEVRALLSRPGLLDACYDLEAWRAFALTFARIRPRGDVLPATVEWRPGFIGATVAPLDMAGASLPFHLCDLVASVLATGQAPEIVEAWRLVPEGVADGLRPIRLPGGVRLDLTREGADLGAALKEAKARAKVDPRHWLGAASKGIAVAMSFGNLARVDPDSDAIILGPDGERLVCGGNGEKPGPLGFLPMAAAVTAGGRLLIAMAKRAIEDLGGSVAAIHTDSVLVPADDVAHLVACPGGPHRLDDGTDAVRCLSHEQVRAITDRFSAIGVTWKAENGTGEGTTWGMCLGANKVLLGRFDESGTFRIVRSSDTSLGAHLLDPTGTGALTEDGRSGWAADLEELLLAANIGGDPNGSLVVPELPPWAGLPVVRHDRASTPRTLELLRERVGDATLPPFTPYLTVKEAVAVVSGDVPGPDRWLGLDWRRGHGARSGLVVRGPDGWGVGAPGIVSVACSPVADLFGEWTHGTNLSTEGPRRGLRSVVPVVSDGAHVVVVGKAGEVLYLDEREPLEDAPAQRAFGSGGVEELRHRVRVAGVGAVADGAGMSRRCIGKWLAGGGTDRLPAIAGAVADLECSTPTETPMPVACERVGCDQPARPRSRTCSNACKVALRRGRPVAPLIDNVSPVAPPVAPPIGNVPWPTEPGVWVGSELPEYIDGVRWSIALAVAKPADCDPWGSDNPADPDAEDLEPEEWWARFSAGRSR